MGHWDQLGPLPKAIQARIRLQAKRESHLRFLERLADEPRFSNSRPGPIQEEGEDRAEEDEEAADPSPESP